MAVLQSIRDKTILVLVMIGGAMAAFILTDLINSGGSSFSSEDNIIGSIADIEISPSDFQEELFFIQNSSQFRSYSEGQQISIAWDKLVQDRLIDMVSILIGSDVTALEIGELQTGAINEVNRDNVFSSFFGIPEMNDVSIIQDFIDDINYQGQKYRVEDKQQFLILEEEVIKQRYTQKYQDLIEKGMYTTSIEARNIFSSRTQNAKVRYVSIPYSSVSQDIDVTDEEIKESAEKSFADEFIKDLPKKYDTLIGENGIRLSGGEKQRLSIARAMLKKTPIILLDEATSSLDAETENKIQQAINLLTKNKTTIVIAHRLSTILNSNKIFVIDNGKISSEGTHEELLEKSSIYKNFYEKQIRKD